MQDYGLALRNTHIVCVNFMSGGIYGLTTIPKDRLLKMFFVADLFILRFFARKLLHFLAIIIYINHTVIPRIDWSAVYKENTFRKLWSTNLLIHVKICLNI